MNIPIIGICLAGAVVVGLHLRANPTLSTAKGAELINSSASTVNLVGARVVSEAGGSVVFQAADGVQVSTYGVLPEGASLTGDATLSKNGADWNLIKFKSYSSVAQTGVLHQVRQRGGAVYGVITPDGQREPVRVMFNNSGIGGKVN